MTLPATRALVISLLLCICTANCGGAGHGGGIGGTGLVVGVITAFGSVIVDDIEFDTTTATITVRGEVADQTKLGLGMVVAIEGRVAEDGLTGVADTVIFESLLEGPIEGVFPASAAADILGDTVVVSDETVLDGVALDAGSVGKVVIVSGFEDADGIIRATRVAARDAIDARAFVIDGRVEDLDAASQRFRIRVVTVDYSSAVFEGGTPDALVDGIEVRVKVSSAPVDGVVRADVVKIAGKLITVDAGKDVRLVGVITERIGVREFVLNHRHTVLVNSDTQVVGGSVDEITRNTIIAIVGTLRADDRILARRIIIRDEFAALPVPIAR